MCDAWPKIFIAIERKPQPPQGIIRCRNLCRNSDLQKNSLFMYESSPNQMCEQTCLQYKVKGFFADLSENIEILLHTRSIVLIGRRRAKIGEISLAAKWERPASEYKTPNSSFPDRSLFRQFMAVVCNKSALLQQSRLMTNSIVFVIPTLRDRFAQEVNSIEQNLFCKQHARRNQFLFLLFYNSVVSFSSNNKLQRCRFRRLDLPFKKSPFMYLISIANNPNWSLISYSRGN